MEAQAQAQASEDKPEPPHNPKFFRHLCYLEFAIVLSIGLAVICVALYLLAWIIWGWRPEIHARLNETLRGANIGWKIGLLIMVPLFFRPLAKFLIHLKKAHGWETDEITPKSADQESYGSARR